MIDYIKGKIATISPTNIVVENNGIGYTIEISLQTYDALNGKTETMVYIQSQTNPRDGQTIEYGFASKEEREIFRDITGVSGMGASSARMILSSMTAGEFREAVLSEDINKLKSVKGIGMKSAQRMVLELKDKIIKSPAAGVETLFHRENNTAVTEAESALLLLGFSRPNVSKAIQAIIKEEPEATVEEIIKAALKAL